MHHRTVFVVEHDPKLRRSLQHLFAVESYRAEVYACGESFLRRRPPDHPACLLMDVAMPGCSGLEVQARLTKWLPPLPVIFMASQPSVPIAVQAMKNGAIDFIIKPARGREILAAVEQALVHSESAWTRLRQAEQLLARVGRLTVRERAVFELVAEGLPNKQAAAHLGITEKTVKVHRSRVMHKLEVGSLAELVRLATRLADITGPTRPLGGRAPGKGPPCPAGRQPREAACSAMPSFDRTNNLTACPSS
ncbi:MAG TPA: response regulator [Gammaproteobacteria bacterium]|nr:response regulator [Gammaproteobacteria bacterium]